MKNVSTYERKDIFADDIGKQTRWFIWDEKYNYTGSMR